MNKTAKLSDDRTVTIIVSNKPTDGISENDAEMDIRDEYRRAWALYREGSDGEMPQFLGVAFYDRKYKKLVADKVFFRGDENGNIS